VLHRRSAIMARRPKVRWRRTRSGARSLEMRSAVRVFLDADPATDLPDKNPPSGIVSRSLTACGGGLEHTGCRAAHLTCNEGVTGPSPVEGSKTNRRFACLKEPVALPDRDLAYFRVFDRCFGGIERYFQKPFLSL
jgi:hypothetical protein